MIQSNDEATVIAFVTAMLCGLVILIVAGLHEAGMAASAELSRYEHPLEQELRLLPQPPRDDRAVAVAGP